MARGVLHSGNMKPEKPTKDGNQGEGDKASARRYGRHVREFVADGKVDPAAKDAEAFVEGRPEDAERAERQARRGPKPTRVSIDELMAKGHTVIDRVQAFVHRVADRFGRGRR